MRGVNAGTAKATHPDGEAEVDTLEDSRGEGEEIETKLLTTRDLAVLERCVNALYTCL